MEHKPEAGFDLDNQPSPGKTTGETSPMSPVRHMINIAAIIFTAETLIMVFFGMFPGIPESYHTLLDATLVTLLTLPAIYIYLYRPLHRQVAEREKAEKKARDSEKDLGAILDSIQDTYYRTDKEGFLVRVSSPAEELLGYRQDELLGTKVSDLYVDPDGREKFLKELSEQGGKISNYESLINRRDGSEVWVSTNAQYYRDENGVIQGVEGTSRDISKRKAALAEVDRQNEFLKRIIESLSHPFYVIDAETYEIEIANSTARELGDLERVKTCYELTHKRSKPCVGDHSCPLEEVKKTKQAVTMEHIHYDKDGNKGYYEVHGFPIFDKDGNVNKMIEYSLDITERKVAARELKAAQEKTEAILKTVGEGIIVINKDSIIQYINKESLNIFGYASEEVLDQNLEMLMPEKYRQAHSEGLKRYLETGEKNIFGKWVELEGLKKDGSIFPIELRIEETTFGEKEGCHFTAAMRDITTRKQTEENLLRLATAVEQTAESIVITDSSGMIQYVNPAFEKISGYKRDEVIGDNPRILKSGKQNNEFYKRMWITISLGKAWSGNFINKKKNGSLYDEEATITPILDSDGSIINYVAVKRDVTMEKRLERQARQSQKMQAIGTLAGGVAHDFNNLLAAITGYTELARDALPKGSEARENLLESLKACVRAKDLVNQILTFSRQTEKEMKPFLPHLVIKESIKLLQVSIPPNIEIKVDIEDETNTILGDPTQISQVVMNLCANAMHAMEETGGRLTVSLKSIYMNEEMASSINELDMGNYLLLTISDTGHGMNKETMDRIFDPFFTTKDVGKGTGMGLSATHGIITSHQGVITVSSKLEEGATFHIYFPQVKVSVQTENGKDEQAPGGNELILLIDDEKMVADVNKKSLKRLGYDVISRTDPIEALKTFSILPGRFGLVITDLKMPKMTGIELAEKLTKIRADIPIILLTGYNNISSKVDMGKIGIRESLDKPVAIGKMANAIRRALDNGKQP